MKAKVTDWCAGEKRMELKEIVPLETPLSILIEPANLCNFRCFYCEFTKKRKSLGRDNIRISKNESIMSYEMFEKIVHDMKMFPQRVKAINLSRSGEPLVNENIANMVKLAKDENVCDEIIIITNGSLLNPVLSKKLIDAGLDVLRISIQGITSKQYMETCGYDLNLDGFLENIKFFYNNRGSCKVFIKILDEIIEGEEEKFFNIFGDICDEIAIEHIIKDKEEILDRNEKHTNMFFEEVQPAKVCSSPFYTLNICSNGDVLPCCSTTEQNIWGNVMKNSLYEIWDSKEMNELRTMILKNNYKNALCKNCNVPFEARSSKDNIDEVKDKLLSYYEDKLK